MDGPGVTAFLCNEQRRAHLHGQRERAVGERRDAAVVAARQAQQRGARCQPQGALVRDAAPAQMLSLLRVIRLNLPRANIRTASWTKQQRPGQDMQPVRTSSIEASSGTSASTARSVAAGCFAGRSAGLPSGPSGSSARASACPHALVLDLCLAWGDASNAE